MLHIHRNLRGRDAACRAVSKLPWRQSATVFDFVEEVRPERLLALLTKTWLRLARRRRGGHAITAKRLRGTEISRFVDYAGES
jgi:hypothetical protein